MFIFKSFVIVCFASFISANPVLLLMKLPYFILLFLME